MIRRCLYCNKMLNSKRTKYCCKEHKQLYYELKFDDQIQSIDIKQQDKRYQSREACLLRQKEKLRTDIAKIDAKINSIRAARENLKVLK